MKTNVVIRYKIKCGESKEYKNLEDALRRVKILETLGYQVELYEVVYTLFSKIETLVYATKFEIKGEIKCLENF